MKKILALILVVLLMFTTLAACSSTQTAAKKEAKDLKIALFIKNQVNKVFLDGQAGAQACADEYGAKLTVLAPTTPNSNDEQVTQILNTIATGVDAMVISPCDTSGVVSAIEKARAEGIKVIIIADKVAKTEVDGTAMINAVDAAYQVTVELCKKLEGKGNVVIITPPLGNPSGALLVDGAKKALAEYPNIKILAEQSGNFLRKDGMNVMQDFLQTYQDINAVIGLNDEMSLGAIEAIKAKGATGILVASLDASTDGLKAMLAGDIFVDCDKNWYGVGYTGVLNAIKACTGKDYEKDFTVETVLVTQANLAEIAAKKGVK
ncbi:MAG: sugar ABC transporter substrate-binding protein [Christensenellales bacterium]